MRMRLNVVLFLLLALGAQAGPLQDYRRSLTTGAHYSLTRQFIVHEAPITADYYHPLDSSSNLTRLDPTLLPVSCERIKTALLKTLGARDEWKGTIFLDLHLGRYPNESILVTPALFGNAWMYRIQLPDLLERPRLVSAVVEVLLLEMANRQSVRSTEIPAWLAEGLTREVMLSSQIELVIEPPRANEKGFHQVFAESTTTPKSAPQSSNTNGATINRLLRFGARTDAAAQAAQSNPINPLAPAPLTVEQAQMSLAHQSLRDAPPLSLDELSWPREGQLTGDAGEAYRSSAQLFVHELLRLPDGPAALQAMIRELPQHLNWQISFLNAFHADFPSQLDLDKWWTLHLLQFTGRDLARAWSSAESWQKLDEIVRPAVQVRATPDDLPALQQTTLSAIILEWDSGQQSRIFREKSQQLQLLRQWVSPELVALADDYRRTLDNYVRRRVYGVYNPMGHALNASRQDPVVRDTLRDIAALEARREQLRPKADAPAPVAVTVPANQN